MSEAELRVLAESTGLPYDFFEKIYSSKLSVFQWDELDLKKISLTSEVQESINSLAIKLELNPESIISLFKQGYLITKPLKPEGLLNPLSRYHSYSCVDARENAIRRDGLSHLLDEEEKREDEIISSLAKDEEERFMERWAEADNY